MTAAPEASTALCLLDGAGPGQGAPSPCRRRPRPRPPPPRAARSVPAARLGRSGPPLSSARSCCRRRAPAAAAAAVRADGGPGGSRGGRRALALGLDAAVALRPGTAFASEVASAFARLLKPRTLSGRAAPGAPRPAPARARLDLGRFTPP